MVMTPDEIAQASAQALRARDNALRHLSISIVHVGPGTATLLMKTADFMLNGIGLCHGGFIFTLADAAFAYACNGRGEAAVSQHCTISYLQPAGRDEELTATAVELARNGRNGIYDIKVSNEKGEVIAVMRGNSRTLPGRSLVAPSASH